jgi:hypothetical protein
LHTNLYPFAATIAEEETVSAIVFDGPSIRFALLDGFPNCSAKICADRQVFNRENTSEQIVGHQPMRDSASIRGCVP